MTWSERVAPGVAVMRERSGGNAPAALDSVLIRAGELRGAADTLERMAAELDNAHFTIRAICLAVLLGCITGVGIAL